MSPSLDRLIRQTPQPPASAWNFTIGDVIAFHCRFYEEGIPDTEEEVREVERKLGTRLPPLLRGFFRGTWLRGSQQLHLVELNRLELDENLLVFGHEQQACWRFAISALDPSNDPRVLTDVEAGGWQDDGITLSQWLALFTLINRPYETPCVDLPFDGGEAWRVWSASLGFAYFHVKDGIVANETATGGSDIAALAQALAIAPEEIETDDDEGD